MDDNKETFGSGRTAKQLAAIGTTFTIPIKAQGRPNSIMERETEHTILPLVVGKGTVRC